MAEADDRSSPGPKHRPGRRARRLLPIFLSLAILLLAALAGIWLYRTALVERIGLAWLAELGLAPARLQVEAVDLGSIRLGEARLGRHGTIGFRAAEATYELDDLRHGRVETLIVEGLTLTARPQNGSVVIDGLDELLTVDGERTGAPATLLALPVRKLVLRDFRLRLEGLPGLSALAGDGVLHVARDGPIGVDLSATLTTSRGPVSVRAAGSLAPDPDDRLRLEADFDAAGNLPNLATNLHGGLAATADGNVIAGTVAIRDAAVAHAIGATEGLNGELRFALDDGRPTAVSLHLDLGPTTLLGEAVHRARIALDYGASGLAANLDAAWDGGTATARIQSTSSDPAGPASLSIQVSADAGWLGGRLPSALSVEGSIVMTAAGKIAAPGLLLNLAAPADLAALGELHADIELRLQQLSLPSWAEIDAVAGLARVEIGNGTLQLVLPDGLRLDRLAIAGDRLDGLPQTLRTALDRPLTAELRPAKDHAAAITLRAGVPGAELQASLDAAVRGKALNLTGTADLSLGLDEQFAIRRVAASEIGLKLADARLDGMRLTGQVRFRNLAGTAEALSGSAAVDLVLSGQPVSAELTTAGSVTLDGERLEFRPDEAGMLRLRPLDAGSIALKGPVELRPIAGREAWIAYDLEQGAASAKLAMRPGTASLTLGAGRDGVEARLAAQALDLDWQSDGAMHLTVTEGRIMLPGYAVEAGGVRADVELAADGRHQIGLHADRLRHLGDPPFFIPLVLDLRAQGNAARSALRGELTDSGKRLVIGIEGEHAPVRGTGHAALTLQPVTFLPTVLQPPQLFPAMAEHLESADGRMGASATLEWGPDGLRSTGVLDLALRELQSHGAEFRDAAARISFDDLAPPSTPPDQTIRIGQINVGLPFTDGLIAFELYPDGQVAGRLDELRLFGGSIRTEPFAFDPWSPNFRLVLEVAEVDLEQFLAFAEYGELSATGTLHGTIPVAVTPDGVAIRHAVLTTGATGGEIRYRPRDAAANLASADENMALVMRALEQFHYETIRVEIDENAAGELSLRVSLQGSSPKVYDGYPIVLNVNFSGDLADVLRHGLRAYQLPAEIGRRLQEEQR